MGQPPIPFNAPSNRRQPACTAASSLAFQLNDVECRCTPIVESGYAGTTVFKMEPTCVGVAMPMVSAIDMIPTSIEVIAPTHFNTMLSSYGSPYKFPKPIEI